MHRGVRPPAAAALALTALLATGGCSASSSGGGDDIGRAPVPASATASSAVSASTTPQSTTQQSTAPQPAVTPSRFTAPRLAVQQVASGLEHGWDIGFLPDGKILVSQRPARLALISGNRPGATVTTVDADLSDVMVRGEGGLLGLVVHPDFATSRLFTTCQTHQANGEAVDIRLVTWRLSDDDLSADPVRTLLSGLPVAAGGRHSGCRPTIAADGALLVGTGDTAQGNVSQDRTILGGKVLRLDLKTGQPLPDNPFVTSANANERYVYTYGHRNVQGVAVRPGTGQVFTAEHGPSFNDEVNLIRAGANYGWDPSKGGTEGGYDESVSMTDLERFPDAVEAVWSSGATTQAVCAATFLDGPQWGPLDGDLVITALKGAKLLLLHLDAAGAVTSVAIPVETNGAYGRLRAARQGPDRALYVTTTNGSDDKLLRITLA